MSHQNKEGYEERTTKIMLSKPITELSRLIGMKWFLPIEKLSQRSGVSLRIIYSALAGEKLTDYSKSKLMDFLINYKGEIV